MMVRQSLNSITNQVELINFSHNRFKSQEFASFGGG